MGRRDPDDDYVLSFDRRGHDYNLAGEICPMAREAERAALLERARLDRAQRLVDVPAGGGYVAHGVRARLAGDAEIICIEPSRRFGAGLRDAFTVYHEPMHAVSLPDASVDLVLSLAGLHHLSDRQAVFDEWARILRPGGQVVVADVADATPPAEFLNGFVDRFTPGGHAGRFLGETEFTTGLTASGLEVSEDVLEQVPWRFPDIDLLGRFCWQLFSCRLTTPAEVARGLADVIGITNTDDGVQLNWQLQYAVATRPLPD